MKFLSFFCLCFFVFSGWHDSAEAHRVRIFAYGQGEYIVGGTSFSGGRKLKNAEIIVNEATEGKTLFRTKTDNQGDFRFRIPMEARKNHLDLLIVVNGGDGHRGEWPLSAAEYLDSTETDRESIQPEKTDGEIVNSFENNKMSSFQDIQEQQIRRIVEEALEKKLAPIKYMLAESRDQGPRLRDILGGIGYILGLAGIVVYFKSKKREV